MLYYVKEAEHKRSHIGWFHFMKFGKRQSKLEEKYQKIDIYGEDVIVLKSL